MFGFLLISAALVVAPALTRPQEPAPQEGVSTPIPIVSQSAETKEDGGFSYSFETGNGIKVEEVGTVKQGAPSVQGRSAAGADEDDGNNTVVVLQGSFSYTGPDGKLYSIKYIADENGFQPEGDHLPTPPPGLEDAINEVKHSIQVQAVQQPVPQQVAQESVQSVQTVPTTTSVTEASTSASTIA